MNNCELIIRDVGTSKLYVIKRLNETNKSNSFIMSKNIINCAPPFKDEKELDYIKCKIDDLKISFKEFENSKNWKLYLDDDNFLHLEFYIEHCKQVDFINSMIDVHKNFYNTNNHVNPDLTLIGYREKRESKISELLD